NISPAAPPPAADRLHWKKTEARVIGSVRSSKALHFTEETQMEMIQQILSNFRDTLPTNSKTAEAIARGASAEEIATSASAEGLHALSGALFEALEQQNATGSPGESDNSVLGALSTRLRDFRGQLPDDSATAQ